MQNQCRDFVPAQEAQALVLAVEKEGGSLELTERRASRSRLAA